MKHLKFLLVAVFLNSLCWIVLIPIWQYPDEQAHYAQVESVAQASRAQSENNTSKEVTLSEEIMGTDRDHLGNNKYTYHPNYRPEYSDTYYGPRENELINLKGQKIEWVKKEATNNPPLYYLVASFGYKLTENGDLFEKVFTIRLISSIFFTLTIFTAYKIGTISFKNNLLAIVLAALIAFMPMFVFAQTGALPDPLINFLFTALIYLLLKVLNGKSQAKDIVSIGLIIFLGTITRQHFLIALPLTAIVFFYKMYKSKNLSKFFVSITIVFLVLFLIEKYLTPYPVISNFRIPDISVINLEKVSPQSFLEHKIWTLKHTYSEVLPWYWGVYKWLSLTLPHQYYEVVNRLLLIAGLGLAIYFGKMARRRKKLSSLDVQFIFMAVFLAIYYASFVVWDYFFRLKNGFSFGVQGRYFFPLIVPTFALILIGFSQIFSLLKKYKNYGFFLLVTLVIFANNYSLFFVASSYYDVSSFDTFIKQASQYKPEVIKGNIIVVLIIGTLMSQLVFLFWLGLATLREKNENS